METTNGGSGLMNGWWLQCSFKGCRNVLVFHICFLIVKASLDGKHL